MILFFPSKIIIDEHWDDFPYLFHLQLLWVVVLNWGLSIFNWKFPFDTNLTYNDDDVSDLILETMFILWAEQSLSIPGCDDVKSITAGTKGTVQSCEAQRSDAERKEKDSTSFYGWRMRMLCMRLPARPPSVVALSVSLSRSLTGNSVADGDSGISIEYSTHEYRNLLNE